MRRSLSIAAVVVLTAGISVAAASQGRAEKLWSQKPQGAPPLAQVPDFSALAAQVNPAVVSIQVRHKVKLARHLLQQIPNPFGDDVPWPFRFFGNQGPDSGEVQAVGSGFVIDSEGLILTNNHVVEDADKIEVSFAQPDGTEKSMSATVIGSAPDYDIALIKTEKPARAPIVYLGDSDAMKIGDWVMAIGNPFGLSHSVSVGIISAKGRRDIAPSGRQGLYNFIQTDASINPGNSGGPLVNMNGEVIGINTAINAAGQGIGFAIPINMVKTMLPQLKEQGRFTRSWIGVKVQGLSDDLAQSYGLHEARGALVSEVVPNGPAAKAGIEEGDVILRFDGKPVNSVSDLPLYVGMHGAGQKADVEVWRDGKSKTLAVKLSEFPDDEVATRDGQGSVSEGGDLGLVVADLTPDLRAQLQLEPGAKGVVIRDVESDSPAAHAGLRPGDLVISVNGQLVHRARSLVAAVKSVKSGGVVRLKVQHQGARLFVAIRKP